jgi:hypothetical protein
MEFLAFQHFPSLLGVYNHDQGGTACESIKESEMRKNSDGGSFGVEGNSRAQQISISVSVSIQMIPLVPENMIKAF